MPRRLWRRRGGRGEDAGAIAVDVDLWTAVAHDLDALLACYADEVEVDELPSMTCTLRDTEALRARI